MLTSIHVRNFALIDHLELSFGDGLNILTGETGAGKSIIIDALGIALGERASTEMIRSDTDKLSIEAIFTLTDASQSTHDRLVEHGLENDDDPETLVMARELSKAGKSQSRVNGRLVPTAILRQIGQDLVDVHGQHDHQSLLSPDTHIDLLDNWLGQDFLALRKKVSDKFTDLSQARHELDQLIADSRERARNLDLYKFQQSEIDEAGLKADELEALTAERTKLSNSEKLRNVAEETYLDLSMNVSEKVTTALNALTKVRDIDPELVTVVEQITESSAYLEEAISLLRRYRETLDSEPGRLEEVNERLDLIHALQRKYGDTVSEIISYGKDLEQKLYALEDSEFQETELAKQIAASSSELDKLSADLTTRRKKGADRFSKAIIAELQDLAMSQTLFQVSVQSGPMTAKGSDKVEFLISTNPGEPLRPLAKVASGGETSRLMLSIKSVLARSSYVPTMIFDEIDTGIGGRTGRVLADKLASLGTISQILCITHLPQIASRPAAQHFSIEKSVKGGRTTVTVIPLSPKDRELEIARMLGGDSSQTVLQHAREMLAAR